ncbi:MAG TPA: thiamine pyrophosphate-dependent enzyme [Microbacteriaceae bacterium]|nr:thiamine pyrophosphate-dependent enzyme [Microbacteriaceae bacterium]
MNAQTPRTGGQLVVDTLEKQGVTRVSCVPGESFLPVLDALLDSEIEIDVCRHEAGAGNMAVAAAKLTGKVGVAAASRGPGSMHAAIAVHTAEQDALPLILLIGQVALKDRGRGGFQEMEYHQMFGSVAKWVTSLDAVERIPETVARAVRIAEGGRPGPVVIEMPEDVLAEVAKVADVPFLHSTVSAPTSDQAQQVANMMSAAKRPVVIVGRSKWSSEAAHEIEELAKRLNVPVFAGFRCQDYINNDSAFYAGHLGFNIDKNLRQHLAEADVILSIGGHFGDVETQGYEILQPREGLQVIHISNSEFDLDRYLQATLAIEATPLEFIEAVLAVAPTDETGNAHSGERSEWVKKLRDEETARATPKIGEGDALADIMGWLQEELTSDTIIANGAGNYAVWVHRFLKYREYGTQMAPASGAMGFGLPAGISASRVRPEQPVVIFGGDGCFTMALPELSTLVGSDANVTIIVVNNGTYGTIRLHQEKRFPKRVSGTDLVNPDFVALAKSYGLNAARVDSVADFAESYTEFKNACGPRLIEVVIDQNRSTPDVLLSTLTN